MSYTLQFTEGGKEKTVDIQDAELLIGRAPDCGLVLAQPGISRHHCKITQENGAVFIEDLNSKNGTRVNNIYIKKTELNPGDSIIVAEFFVQFQPKGGWRQHRIRGWYGPHGFALGSERVA